MRPSTRAFGALVAVAFFSQQAEAREVTVPANVGIGPAVHLLSGPLQDRQLLHYGLKLRLFAVIDQATIQANKDRVPARYRGLLSKQTELRISPLWYVPDTLFLSPKTNGDTQMWGVSWTPLGLGLTLTNAPVRISVNAALRLTYAYIGSESLGDTHFLRPGIDLGIDVEFPISDSFLVSLGWTSQLHIPQRIGAGVFETGPLDESLWHIGQAYLLLHFRFPYTTNF